MSQATGTIHWGKTNADIEIYCSCGKVFHWIGDYAYYSQCPECRQIYEANKIIQLTAIDEKDVKDYDTCIKEDAK